jgi:small-conductance mechanosensitive channel
MKRKCAIITNLFVGVMSFAAWLWMVFAVSHGGPLTEGGLFSLKFFTVLSNLFNGAVSIVFAVQLLRGKFVTRRMKTWRLTGVSAAGLTFTTVMLFLGPVFGFQYMFNGANFFLHFLLPVVSMLSFILLEREGRMPFRFTCWAMVPVLLYSAGYLSNILVQGVGDWPNRHDFYGFLLWGWPVGVCIAIGLTLVTWGLAIALRALGKAN